MRPCTFLDVGNCGDVDMRYRHMGLDKTRGGSGTASGPTSILGRRSTIVGLPPSAVPNFAKSLIVVARIGFSDAARRSIVSRSSERCTLSERSFFARAPLGCAVLRARDRDLRDDIAA